MIALGKPQKCEPSTKEISKKFQNFQADEVSTPTFSANNSRSGNPSGLYAFNFTAKKKAPANWELFITVRSPRKSPSRKQSPCTFCPERSPPD